VLIRPPRRGLFFPPGAVPTINEAHPAAGRLQAAYLFGSRPLAIRAGFGNLSVKSGTPAPAMGRTGAYTSYTAIAGHQGSGGPSGAVSIVVVAMRGITAGSAGLSSNVQVLAATNNNILLRNGLEFTLGNSYVANINRIYIQCYTAGASSAPDAIWIDGRKDATASFESSSDLTNGVWYGVGTTVTNLAVGNGALVFGTFDDPFTFGLTGGIQAAFFFRGVLPDGLMSELTANPAALFAWPNDVFLSYAVRGAGAPTITADLAATLADATLSATAQVGEPEPDTAARGGDDAPARREDIDRLARRRKRQEAEQTARAAQLRATIERAYRAATGEADEEAEATLAEAVQIAPPAMRERIADVVPMLGTARALAELRAILASMQTRRDMLAREDDEMAFILSVL
jgi:hypothetical protein